MAYENPSEGALRESGAQAAAVEDIDTADGSDAGTTQALANDTKAKVNELMGALRDANLLASS